MCGFFFNYFLFFVPWEEGSGSALAGLRSGLEPLSLAGGAAAEPPVRPGEGGPQPGPARVRTTWRRNGLTGLRWPLAATVPPRRDLPDGVTPPWVVPRGYPLRALLGEQKSHNDRKKKTHPRFYQRDREVTVLDALVFFSACFPPVLL